MAEALEDGAKTQLDWLQATTTTQDFHMLPASCLFHFFRRDSEPDLHTAE
jgi:hypothetical protein